MTQLRPGDEVFGFVGHGGFAEDVSAREDVLALRPPSIGFEPAATVPLAAMTALQDCAIREASRQGRGC